MVRNWQVGSGLFSVASNWSPSQAPAAGDSLYVQNGNVQLAGQSFGSSSVQSTIGLTGASTTGAPTLSLANATLTNVEINEAPPAPSGMAPTGYYSPKYGAVSVSGTVVNNGGTIEGGRDSRLAGNLTVSLQPGATLVNKGRLVADPLSRLTITGTSGTNIENDKSIVAAGGTVSISAHLTGTGEVDVQVPGSGTTSKVELNAAVEAGQTFQIARSVLQIDQPASFLGQVDVAGSQGPGQVKLEGLNAASWDAQGSLVELFDATGARIDTLRFTTPQTPAALSVYSAPDTTFGHAVMLMPTVGTVPPTGATLLPQHIA